jgi:hypothetical protein
VLAALLVLVTMLAVRRPIPLALTLLALTPTCAALLSALVLIALLLVPVASHGLSPLFLFDGDSTHREGMQFRLLQLEVRVVTIPK